jgi:exopolyphosphatase/guanosine-5'-triphosphate,3'-diphosphate pyrophosphatase
MKFAAIDIGSNAIRFQISRPMSENDVNASFKKVEYTRLPLRLGEDVFLTGKLSEKKINLLDKAMQAFQFLMEIYNVDGYMACATSAMRDTKNAKEVVQMIHQNTGVKIKVISGKKESLLIRQAVLDDLPTKNGYIHIDVGGGSTEVSFLINGKLKATESFDVGAVRSLQNANLKNEKQKMKEWVKEKSVKYDNKWKGIGTGGNINKLYRLLSDDRAGWMSFKDLKNKIKQIEKLSQKDRIYKLNLNPDRAEVIDHAGRIYTDIMSWANSDQMYVSGKGLKEGIIKELWRNHLRKQS